MIRGYFRARDILEGRAPDFNLHCPLAFVADICCGSKISWDPHVFVNFCIDYLTFTFKFWID
jgi:hypothetical protein